MARHLNLLASQAREPQPGSTGLPAASLLVVAAGVAVAAGGALAWSHLTEQRLAAQVAASPASAPAGAAPRLDAAVVAELERRVRERESLARALTGGAGGTDPGAPASRWLDALADAAGPGVSVSTLRLEPGPRLTITGAGVQPSDINGFLARLQAHPLAGLAAIGQLEIRRGEGAADKLAFRLTPPPPEGWSAPANGPTPTAVSSTESRTRNLP